MREPNYDYTRKTRETVLGADRFCMDNSHVESRLQLFLCGGQLRRRELAHQLRLAPWNHPHIFILDDARIVPEI